MSNKKITVTSFSLPIDELTNLKIMSALTHCSMGYFIRVAVKDKIKQLKENQDAK